LAVDLVEDKKIKKYMVELMDYMVAEAKGLFLVYKYNSLKQEMINSKVTSKSTL